MTLIDDHQMVQTLSPDTADDPFGKRILKRRPRSRDHLFDPHPFDSVLEIFGIDAVAVAEQIPGSLILGEGIDDLKKDIRSCGQFT